MSINVRVNEDDVKWRMVHCLSGS